MLYEQFGNLGALWELIPVPATLRKKEKETGLFMSAY
jgi:hypothetical protein